MTLRQQTDRIHSLAVLNGFEQNSSTGILFLNANFLLIPQHTSFNVYFCYLNT